MPTFRITVNATGAQVDGDYAAPDGMSAWSMAQEAGDVPADAMAWDYTIIEISPEPLFDQFVLWQANHPTGEPLPRPIEGTMYGTWLTALAELEACNPLEGRYLTRISDGLRWWPETGTWGDVGSGKPGDGGSGEVEV